MIDTTLILSENQSITADATSTNTIDLGGALDTGNQNMKLVVACSDAGASDAVGASVQIQLQVSADKSTWDTILYSKPLDLGATAGGAGWTYEVGLPNIVRRYIRLNYVVTGTITDAPGFTAYLARI